MADNSQIQWTDATWNPITGCSVVSPGCTNCYAMKMAGTRLAHHPSRAGLTRDTKAGPVWTGEVRFNEQWLDQPLRWKRPRMIFVCAHADLFHENVPDAWIDQVFAVMALAPQHTFQVLTKRAERMWRYFGGGQGRGGSADFTDTERRIELAADRIAGRPAVKVGILPLPNVWLGVSAEDQQRADERVLHLLDTPAAVRWVSAEPLLGGMDLRLPDDDECYCDHDARASLGAPPASRLAATHTAVCPHSKRIDWLVAGGESGPGARPMHPDWARGLRDQCKAAGVAFFFKQWGAFCPYGQLVPAGGADGERGVFDLDDGTQVLKIGKGRAGRLLDGVEHNGMPR